MKVHVLLALCWGLSAPVLRLELAKVCGSQGCCAGQGNSPPSTPIPSHGPKPRQSAPLGTRSALMYSLIHMHKPTTSWRTVQKPAEDPSPPNQGAPNLCTSFTRPYLGLCYSSGLNGWGKGIRSGPGEFPPPPSSRQHMSANSMFKLKAAYSAPATIRPPSQLPPPSLPPLSSPALAPKSMCSNCSANEHH
jgi:hypothetical protein